MVTQDLSSICVLWNISFICKIFISLITYLTLLLISVVFMSSLPFFPLLLLRPSLFFLGLAAGKPFLQHDFIRLSSLTFVPCCKWQLSLWGLWWLYWTIHTQGHARTQTPTHTHLFTLYMRARCHGICPSQPAITLTFRCVLKIHGLQSCWAVLEQVTSIPAKNNSRFHGDWNANKVYSYHIYKPSW